MNFSNLSPSHRLQFFTNCSSVGPFHGVQSFRNRLLQRGSPAGSQVLPANLLQRGLLSPWGHRSCQEPAPARASHGVTASFGHPPALVWGPPWAAGGYLLHRGPPWAAGGQPASPWSSPGAAGESLCSGAWSTSSPSFFTDLGVCRVVFLTYSNSSLWLQLLFCSNFSPFLNMLSQRHYHRCWWARPWPAAGPSWSRLALALSDMGEASSSFSQKPPL